MTPFIIAGAACLLGAVIMALTNRPQLVTHHTEPAAGAVLATETGSAS
jgi:hypothetical protein